MLNLLAALPVEAYYAIGAGVAALTGIGAGIGIGIATAKAVTAIAKNPDAEKKINKTLLTGLAFAETVAIYGLLVALILLIKM